MIRKFLFAAMIAGALISCSKNDEVGPKDRTEKTTIRLDIGAYQVLTKNTGAINEEVAAMDSIYLLEAFVFRPDGVLESYRRYGISEMNLVGRNNLPLDVTPGEKSIYLVANSKKYAPWVGVTTKDKFLLEDVELRTERYSYFTMSETVKIDPDTVTVPLSVTLKRLVAKIVVNSIRTNFSGTPYQGMSLTNAKLYLTNVHGKKTYMGEEPQTQLILNDGGYVEADCTGGALTSCIAENVHTPVGTDGYTTRQYFYCYENLLSEETATDRFTRLVLEAQLDGNTYYYPIDINQEGYGWAAPSGEKGVKRGTIYTYDIVITGPGSDDPESKITRRSIVLDAQAESFTDGPSFTATF